MHRRLFISLAGLASVTAAGCLGDEDPWDETIVSGTLDLDQGFPFEADEGDEVIVQSELGDAATFGQIDVWHLQDYGNYLISEHFEDEIDVSATIEESGEHTIFVDTDGHIDVHAGIVHH